ncbi:MAG: inosine/xanthosine triphosphatase [Promethearchaeota archaeon]
MIYKTKEENEKKKEDKIEEIIIAIGTKNPIKIQAAKEGFEFIFPDAKLKIFQYLVDSEVGDQPIGFDSIIKGSINRAQKAYNLFVKEHDYNNPNTIFGVGIESGLAKINYTMSGYMDFQFSAVFHKNNITLGCGSGFEYPIIVIKKILDKEEKEIGDIFEKIANERNIKYKGGAISYLSNGKLKRKEILKNGIIMALIPYIRKSLYFG